MLLQIHHHHHAGGMPNMPAPPPEARPQTLKQARAAYKARGQSTISEAERRRIDRAVELDRRAWRIKEAKKRKVEAAKKRAEKERETQVLLATQRKCDKFGYKSSQMHLGAFLSKGGLEAKGEGKENLSTAVQDDEEFGDSEMDDETLLGALDGTMRIQTKLPALELSTRKPHAAQTTMQRAKVSRTTANAPQCPTTNDFASLFDDFGSSTQIARELDAERSVSNTSILQTDTAISYNSSAEFDDFDITAEDLEGFSSHTLLESKAEEDRKLMPPPPLPAYSTASKAALDIGFTMSELEQFVEDDLQLTQVAPR